MSDRPGGQPSGQSAFVAVKVTGTVKRHGKRVLDLRLQTTAGALSRTDRFKR
jgi:hypothetical protein